MTAEAKEKTFLSIDINDPHRVSVVFVNQLVGSGHLNGVVNLSFAVANFTPSHDGAVSPDLVMAARLRLDLYCAQQLRDALTSLLEQALKPANGTTH